MLSITNYSRNANENYNDVSPQSDDVVAMIKKSTINARQSVEKREPSYTVGGDVNWYIHYGEQYGGSFKN